MTRQVTKYMLVVTTVLMLLFIGAFSMLSNYQQIEYVRENVSNIIEIAEMQIQNGIDDEVVLDTIGMIDGSGVALLSENDTIIHSSFGKSETLEYIEKLEDESSDTMHSYDEMGRGEVSEIRILEDGRKLLVVSKLDEVGIFDDEYSGYYLLVIAMIFSIAIWASRQIGFIVVQPILDLNLATSQIARGKFSRRVIVNRDDEIGVLAQNFNNMADRLVDTLSELERKNDQFESIMASMESGVIAIDQKGRIMLINSYAKNRLGIIEDVIGKEVGEILDKEELVDILKEGELEESEFKVYEPVERHYKVKLADIITSKHIKSGRVAVFQDVTDIQKLGEMRSEFVASVSHELKTPLTSIKGFSETLKDVDDKRILNKFLDIIYNEAERLTRLIEDILTLSALENPLDEDIENQPIVNVKSQVVDVYNLMNEVAKQKGVKLKLSIENVSAIKGSADKLKQMVINLTDNAIKYTDEGDDVVIKLYQTAGNVVIQVKDTGPGIPEESLPRLFERFYRVDKARTRAKGGTGLGLAIVKHIVLQFGGNIDVTSEENKGTTFTVTLPINRE